MTRGMLATVLYRLENEPETAAAELFQNVPSGQYYTNAVTWATQNNIVTGYDNGNFRPDDSITREQLAVMLWRYAGNLANTDSLNGFSDCSQTGTWATEALGWTVAQGIVTGKGNGILDPDNLLQSVLDKCFNAIV